MTVSVPSNGEIEILAALALDAGLVGPAAQVVDGKRVEPLHQSVLQFPPQRPHHRLAELRRRRIVDQIVVRFHRSHHAYDAADGDASALAGEAISAARPAD